MSERKRVTGLLAGCVVALATAMPATAQDAGDPSKIRPKRAEYSPYLNYNYPDRVYFGDTHVHTSYSTDAGMFGNTLGPDAAYRFAKGETVTSSTGVRARLLRPLDWLVVADHAENIGLAPMISESNADLLRSEWGREIHDLGRKMFGDEVDKVPCGQHGDRATFRIDDRNVAKVAIGHQLDGVDQAIIRSKNAGIGGHVTLHRLPVIDLLAEQFHQYIPFGEDPDQTVLLEDKNRAVFVLPHLADGFLQAGLPGHRGRWRQVQVADRFFMQGLREGSSGILVFVHGSPPVGVRRVGFPRENFNTFIIQPKCPAKN